MKRKDYSSGLMKKLVNRHHCLGLSFWVLLAFFLGKSAFAQYMTVKDLLAIPPTPADYTIAYGKDPNQFGQLRLPKGNGPHPVVIVIHGGCWLAEYDLQHISPLATALTRLGLATWSLEYRRVGNNGGGWPATFQDIAQGADYLRELAKKFPLDLRKTIALGHSAGGHFALWLAARSKLPVASPLYTENPLPLRGVISLAGVGDLSRPEYQEICGRVVQKLMGGKPSQVPERYAQGSPIELLPLKVPQILIQGAQDPTVSLESAQAYWAAARKSGDEVKLLVIQKAAHFELVVPTTAAWPEVKKAVKSLLH